VLIFIVRCHPETTSGQAMEFAIKIFVAPDINCSKIFMPHFINAVLNAFKN